MRLPIRYGSSGHRRPGLGNQRGVAVITAMLVVTIATLLAVNMAWNTRLDQRRTAGLLAWDQAREYAVFAEILATESIEDQLEGETVYDRSMDLGAQAGLSISQDDRLLAGGYSDLQGRFNLNNLVDRRGQEDKVLVQQFRRLLEALGQLDQELALGPAEAEVIARSTVDWIDPDSHTDFNGAEDDFYTSEAEPYRTANGWFTSVSELRAVRGVTPEIFTALAPHLAALPVGGQPTLLNFNTASIPVLMSLGDNVTRQNAERWIEDSLDEAVEDVLLVGQGLIDTTLLPYIGYTSSYFALSGFVSIGSYRLDLYSLLEWDGQRARARLRRFGIVEAAASEATAVFISTDADGGLSVGPNHE